MSAPLDVVLIEDYHGEQASQQQPQLTEWFISKITQARSGSFRHSGSIEKSLPKAISQWVESTPFAAVLVGPSRAGKEYLLNTLVQSSLCDPSMYGHLPEDPTSRWEGVKIDETHVPEATFATQLDLGREQRAMMNTVDYALDVTKAPPLDAYCSFLLPEFADEGMMPVVEMRHGPIFELVVAFPSESELRLALWDLHQPSPDPATYALLARLYQLVLSAAWTQDASTLRTDTVQVPPRNCRSPQDIPLPDAVRKVLGRTVAFKGIGRDVHADRLFIRNKLSLLIRSHFAFFAKALVVRAPSSLLEGGVTIHVVPSDASDALSRSKATVAVKQSNLALVTADERGMSADVQALLAASGWLERLLAKPEDHRVLFVQLSVAPEIPSSWAAPAGSVLHMQLRAALAARAPATMADKVDRTASRAAALGIQPRLYASLQLNQQLPLQVQGHTLLQAKSLTGVPALLAAFFNMRLSCCAAPMRDLHQQLSNAGSASKLQQVSAQLEEKIRTWRTDVASTARSLDGSLHSAAVASSARLAELPPTETLNGAWLSCAHLLNGTPGLWRNAIVATAPARMQEVINAHNTVLIEAAKAVEKEADPGEKRRLQRLVGVCKQVNERRVKARMAALRDEVLALDADAVAHEAVRGALLLPSANDAQNKITPVPAAAAAAPTTSLPDVPMEAARRIGARLGHVLDRYDQHLSSLEQETAHSLRALQQALPGTHAHAHANNDPLSAQMQDMMLDPTLEPTAQEHKSSRTNSSAAMQQPVHQHSDGGAEQVLFLSEEIWQHVHETFEREPVRLDALSRRGKPVKFDGSAQFRALAELLYGSEEAHPVVRLLVLGELLAQPALYASSVEGGRRPAPYDEYVAHMARDSAWGDRISLAAAASVLGQHIVIYCPVSPRPLLVPSSRAAPYTSVSETLPLLLVAPNGYEALLHPSRRVTLDQQRLALLPSLKPSAVPSAAAGVDLGDESSASNSTVSALTSDSDSDVMPAKRRLSAAARPSGVARAAFTRAVYSLVDLCIAAVAQHAEQMPSLEGAVPEELLQRLVSHLIAEGRLHNQVLMRMMDSSLFALSLDNCADLNDTSLAIVARACTNLRRLSLENCTLISSEGLAHVGERCALLEVLNVEGCPSVSDAAIRVVAPRCPHLLVLNISATRVTDQGLAALASCRNIHALSLRKTPITAFGLQHLPSELVQLDATDSAAQGDAALHAVATRCAGSMQQLKMSGKNVKDAAVLHLARACTQLRLLELPGATDLTVNAIIAVARHCPLLTSLALPACRRLSLECSDAVVMPNLQHLDLSRCLGVTDAALARWLRAGLLPLLGTLNLSSCEEISDTALTALASHSPHLRSLMLAKCRRVTDAGLLAVIRSCPHLQRLVLTNCTVTDASVAHIATLCRELIELDLACCERVSDVSVRSIVQGCASLETLSLEELPQLSELGLLAVGEYCTALTTLRVGHCKVMSDATLQRLSVGCSRIRSIDLSYCNALTIAAVQRALDAWPALRVLILRGFTGLTVTGLEHARLEVLNASWSKNMDDGALLHTAQACPRLTSLDIAWCTRISDVAIHRLAQKPVHASALRSLNIRGCSKISDLLLKLLANNRRLQVFR